MQHTSAAKIIDNGIRNVWHMIPMINERVMIKRGEMLMKWKFCAKKCMFVCF
jgi:hypothetical protein